MKYTSTRSGHERELPKALIQDVDEYLDRKFPGDRGAVTKGDLQDALLAFRWEGQRLLINQLNPIFISYCLRWEV